MSSDIGFIILWNVDTIDRNKKLYNSIIIKSKYPKRGELLPYFYYLKNKLFDKAIILHDSVFINKKLNLKFKKYKFLWEFEHTLVQVVNGIDTQTDGYVIKKL